MHLGATWGYRGPCWGNLGAILGRLGGYFGSPAGPAQSRAEMVKSIQARTVHHYIDNNVVNDDLHRGNRSIAMRDVTGIEQNGYEVDTLWGQSFRMGLEVQAEY